MDKKRFILISIWLEGDCWSLIVWCNIDSIIIMWVNDVIIMIKVGIKFSVVMMNNVCRVIV